MKILLERDTFTDKSCIGSLSIDGKFECYALEDTDRKLEEDARRKIYGKTAIPRGEYIVIVDYSNRFGRELPKLLNVPGFEGIRIHSGNKPEHSEGCILVGRSRAADFVGQSRLAFEALFAKIERAYESGKPVSIEVR